MLTRRTALPRFIKERWRHLEVQHLALGLLLLLMLVPVAMLLILAGKTGYQFEYNPWGLTLPYHFENYLIMARGMSLYVLNTSIVCVSAIGTVLVLASFTAYIFARFSFPGRSVLFYGIIGLMMIPGVLTMVPAYMFYNSLHLLNTRWVLYLPYVAGGTVFGVFLILPFMASLSEELFEAARLDGAGEGQAFVLIAFPLCRPILATLGIMLLLGQWNDFIWPSITIHNQNLYTVTLGVFSLNRLAFFGGVTEWGLMNAAFVISSLPLIIAFFSARKAFIRGLTSGALKL